jgi:hypothetical protein
MMMTGNEMFLSALQPPGDSMVAESILRFRANIGDSIIRVLCQETDVQGEVHQRELVLTLENITTELSHTSVTTSLSLTVEHLSIDEVSIVAAEALLKADMQSTRTSRRILSFHRDAMGSVIAPPHIGVSVRTQPKTYKDQSKKQLQGSSDATASFQVSVDLEPMVFSMYSDVCERWVRVLSTAFKMSSNDSASEFKLDLSIPVVTLCIHSMSYSPVVNPALQWLRESLEGQRLNSRFNDLSSSRISYIAEHAITAASLVFDVDTVDIKWQTAQDRSAVISGQADSVAGYLVVQHGHDTITTLRFMSMESEHDHTIKIKQVLESRASANQSRARHFRMWEKEQ